MLVPLASASTWLMTNSSCCFGIIRLAVGLPDVTLRREKNIAGLAFEYRSVVLAAATLMGRFDEFWSLLACPIVIDDKAIGALNLYGSEQLS